MSTATEVIKLIFPSAFTAGKYNGDFGKNMILSRPVESRTQIYKLFTDAYNSGKAHEISHELFDMIIDCIEEDPEIKFLTSEIVPMNKISHNYNLESNIPQYVRDSPKYIIRGTHAYRVMNKLFNFDLPKYVQDIHDAGNRLWSPAEIICYNKQVFGTSDVEFNVNQHTTTSYELESIAKVFVVSHILSLRLLKLLPEFRNLKAASDLLIKSRSRFCDDALNPIFMSNTEFYSVLLTETKPKTISELIHSLNNITDVRFVNAAFRYAVSQPVFEKELQNPDNELIKRISIASDEYKTWLTKYPMCYTLDLIKHYINDAHIINQILDRATNSYLSTSGVGIEVSNDVLRRLNQATIRNLIIPLYKFARVNKNVDVSIINAVVEEKYSELPIRECIRFYALQKKVDEIPEKIRKWMYLSNLYEVMKDVIQNTDNTDTLAIAKDLVRIASPDYKRFGVMRKYEPEKMAVVVENHGAPLQSRMTLTCNSRSPPPIDFGMARERRPFEKRYSPPPRHPYFEDNYNPVEMDRYARAIAPIQCDDSYEVTLRNLASYVDRTGNTLALTALVNKQRLLPVELLHSPSLQTGMSIQDMWKSKMQRPLPEELQSHDMFELKLKEAQDVSDPSGTNIYELHHGVEKPCWIFVEGSRILNHISIEKLQTVHIPYNDLANKITHTCIDDIGELTTCPADIWKSASMGRSIRYVAIAYKKHNPKDPTSKTVPERLIDLLAL